MPQQFVFAPQQQQNFDDLLTGMVQNVAFRRQKQAEKAQAVNQYETAVRQGLINPNGAEFVATDDSRLYGADEEQQTWFNIANSGSYTDLNREGGVTSEQQVIDHKDDAAQMIKTGIDMAHADPEVVNAARMSGRAIAENAGRYIKNAPPPANMSGVDPALRENLEANMDTAVRKLSEMRNIQEPPPPAAPPAADTALPADPNAAAATPPATPPAAPPAATTEDAAKKRDALHVSSNVNTSNSRTDSFEASSKGMGLKAEYKGPTVITTNKKREAFYSEDNEDTRSLRRGAFFEQQGNYGGTNQMQQYSTALARRVAEVQEYRKAINADGIDTKVVQGGYDISVDPETASAKTQDKDAYKQQTNIAATTTVSTGGAEKDPLGVINTGKQALVRGTHFDIDPATGDYKYTAGLTGDANTLKDAFTIRAGGKVTGNTGVVARVYQEFDGSKITDPAEKNGVFEFGSGSKKVYMDPVTKRYYKDKAKTKPAQQSDIDYVDEVDQNGNVVKDSQGKTRKVPNATYVKFFKQGSDRPSIDITGKSVSMRDISGTIAHAVFSHTGAAQKSSGTGIKDTEG